MSIEDAIKEAALGMLQGYGVDAVKVVDFTEEQRMDGFCETCYYEWTVVEIKYLDGSGNPDTYEWSGDFADLIRELS